MAAVGPQGSGGGLIAAVVVFTILFVAATIFAGEPPLVLNFEDPDEVLKKQQWAREEIRRRAEKDNLQAKEPENAENLMRR